MMFQHLKNIRSIALPGLAVAACALSGCQTAANIVPTVSNAAQVDGKAISSAAFPATDELFPKPYIDAQEWRDGPVRHFYVHGGFEGTDTRFSYYFPPADQYEGRFFQHVTPVPDSETLAQKLPAGKFNKIGFSGASGAYFIETNGGGTIDLTKGSEALSDPTITAYRANAAAAQFSRHVAQQFYDLKDRPYGYIYGGSGGAFRTIGGLESTTGVWDGGVPYVNGSTMAIPNMFTVRMQALRVLRDKFPQIVDALEPGGSGDPYAGLTDHEASVLREADKMGFPMPSWFGYRTMGLHGFAALYGGVSMADPSYFTDFWTKPGYLGHDQPGLFAEDRLQHESRITGLVTAAEAARLGLDANPFSEANRGGVDTAFILPPGEDGSRIVGLRLAKAPPEKYFLGGELVPESGNSKGQRLFLSRIIGDVVMFGVVNPEQVAQLRLGDAVKVDNSNFLAMESYHRHQVPGPDFPVWDHYRDAKGEPLYPQRPFLVGPLFVQSTAGSQLTGEYDGKAILVASLWDREAMPWQADWYRKRAEAAGRDVRLYFTEHATHGDEPPSGDQNRLVSYQGELQQALRVLAAWVEDGTAPPESTSYRIEDGQVIVPDMADKRLGLQPVVSLTANGGERADVRTGEPVRLEGRIAAPAGGGTVVSAGWDFQGDGSYVPVDQLVTGKKNALVSIIHIFDQPGTYFVGLQGTSQPDEAQGSPYAELTNLDRVRVVVSE
tara:strand:- start:127663 stop:129828 length:2166 start_codon:yes stop_codon:yes gene_type:complete